MRNHIVLTGLSLTISLMIGIALVTANTNNIIKAHVWIHPQQLTIGEHGCPHFSEYVTAFIQPPRNYSTDDIDLASITLQLNGGLVSASNQYAIHGRIVAAQFDRAEVIYLLEIMMGHMTPHPMQRVTLVITGNLHDGNVFRGEDTVNVFFANN